MRKSFTLQKKKFHFIGIGGVGMSGLAQVLLESGHSVSGSDIKPSVFTKRIEKSGGKVFLGHRGSNLGEVDVVVYSSSIRPENPELAAARKMKEVEVIHRARLLARLMKDRVSIAVAGAHGKTTITSLIGWILIKAGFDPTVVVGGEDRNLRGNVFVGRGGYLVTEADESDGSFLCLEPTHSVVANIEREHLDYYNDLEQIISHFSRFINKTRGFVVACADDENVKKAVAGFEGKLVTFGLSAQADIHPKNIKLRNFGSRFELLYKGESKGEIKLAIPGGHNIINALAAIGVTAQLDVEFGAIKKALAEYKGVARRFQVSRVAKDITLIDDYAHHPTEIKATLAAVRHNFKGRVIAVFQPHRFTRTKHLAGEFGTAFADADTVIITKIYSAQEKPIPGVSAGLICEAVKQNGQKDITLIEQMEEISSHIMKIARPGDRIAILGAGSIGRLAGELVKIKPV